MKQRALEGPEQEEEDDDTQILVHDTIVTSAATWDKNRDNLREDEIEPEEKCDDNGDHERRRMSALEEMNQNIESLDNDDDNDPAPPIAPLQYMLPVISLKMSYLGYVDLMEEPHIERTTFVISVRNDLRW